MDNEGEKNVSFKAHLRSIDKEMIEAYELRVGINLPEDFRAFLLSSNGGIPTPQQADIPNTQYSVLVDYLYGIGDSRQPGDLEYEAVEIEEDLLEGMIVIGHDPGGNLFLLATKGRDRGAVYFWDLGGLYLSEDDSGNTFRLADSFSNLLERLY